MTVTGCRVCERQSHAKWHDLAQAELNPMALIEWIEAMPPDLGTLATKTRIIGYVLGCTGIDHQEMTRALWEEQQAANAVDPHADHSGTPTPRD